MSRARIFWVCLLGTVALAGCGGKVVVDAPSGEGGGGGAGPVGPGPGPTTNVASVGPGTSVVVSSGTGGQMCDGQGDCQACVDCALQTACADLWNLCLSTPDCTNLANCIANCPDDQCVEKCAQAFPNGTGIYNEVAFCVVCNACSFDCQGSSENCP